MSNTPSASVDRVCAECEDGTVTLGPNRSSCQPVDACPAGTVTGPSTCDTCDPGSYCAGGTEPELPCPMGTWDHDEDPATACAAKTSCVAGESVDTEGTTTSDRSCAACADGSYSTGVNAESCKQWTECLAGQYVATQGSATSDRVCAGCMTGTYSTIENASSCTSWATCAAGTYVSKTPSATENRACDPCAEGTYTSGANESVCQEQGACPAGTVQTTPGDGTSEPECVACDAGSYCPGGVEPAAPCDDDSWDHDATPATLCAPKTECAAGEDSPRVEAPRRTERVAPVLRGRERQCDRCRTKGRTWHRSPATERREL